jgi:hypothetical protein
MKKLTLSLLAALGIAASAIAYAGGATGAQEATTQNIETQPVDDNATMGRKCPPFC